MRTRVFFLFLVCALIASVTGNDLQICKFPDGKKAMMALTFDDILEDQCKYAPAILDKYGFKATFFMIPNRVGRKGKHKYASLDDIRALVKEGHEIGNHTMGHGSVLSQLTKEDFEGLERSVVGAQETIFELTGVRPQSFCYPGNRRSDETDKWVLQSHLIVTTRNRKLRKTPDDVRAQLQQMIKKGQFGDTMVHGIIEGYDPYKSVEDFDACIGVLKEFENEIAIGTMLETGCYRKRFDNTKLTVQEQTGGRTVYKLELDPEFQRYAGELSLRLPDAEKYQIRLNNSADTVPVKNGIFKVQSGDTIIIIKK